MVRKVFAILMLCIVISSCNEQLKTEQTTIINKIETANTEISSMTQQNIEKSDDSLYPFVNADGLMGYIDKTGLIKINPIYKNAENFNEGLAIVENLDSNFKLYIDTNGNDIFGKAFYNAYSFSEGLAVTFENENKMIVINNRGEVVYERNNVLYAEKYKEGMLLFRDYNGKYGFIDRYGDVIVEPTYEDALDFSEGLAAVKLTDGLVDYIDINGDIVLNTNYIFDTLVRNYQFQDGLACVVNEAGQFGFIDENGEIKIDFVYDYARAFYDGYAAVEFEDGMFGFIDSSGNLAFENTFSNVGDFSEGVASVYDNVELVYGKVGFINTNGELIIDYKYSYGYSAKPSLFPSNSMHNGLIQVKKEDDNDYNNSWIGYINIKDEVIYKTMWSENLFK